MTAARPPEVAATHGQKMIEIRVRLWTNDIARTAGNIVPKHAWAQGVVMMEANPLHGIQPMSPRPFHSLLDLGAVIEKVLIAHGVVLHPGQRMSKYVQP
jgi:hypothetical protein